MKNVLFVAAIAVCLTIAAVGGAVVHGAGLHW